MKRYILAIVLIVVGTMTGHAQFAGANTNEYKTKTSTNYEGNVTRGYKGYIEIGGAFGRTVIEGHWVYRKSASLFGGIYTSHGYLFNPFIYIGAGIGLAAGTGYDGGDFLLPIFAEFRSHLANPNRHRHVPFVSLRVGGSPLKDTKGGYCNLSLGYRFTPNYIPGAFNLSMGYQGSKNHRHFGGEGWGSYFSLRLGYEF